MCSQVHGGPDIAVKKIDIDGYETEIILDTIREVSML
jgi:hypothetical protein